MRIEGAAEARSSVEVPEPPQWIIAMFHAPLSLLKAIVQIGVAAVEYVLNKRFTDRPWIGVMPVGGHPLWRLLHDFQCCPEEAVGRVHIPVLAEQRIDEVARAINGPVKLLP